MPDSTLDLQKNAQNIGNISLLLRSVFPNTSIYPVLGNHDEYPADAYPPAPGSDYYTTILHQAHFDKLLTNDTAAQFQTGQYRFFLSLNWYLDIYIYMSPKQHHICKSCLKIKMQLGLKHGASGAPCQCSNHWPRRPILKTNSHVVHSCNLGDINVRLWSFCVEKYYIRYIYVKKTWFGNDNGNLCYFT